MIVLTGPSGAGKGTMVQELLARVPRLRLAVSATTRTRRPGEVDGVHYWFITDEEFDRRLDGRRLPRVPRVPVGPAVGDARSRSSTGSPSEGDIPLLELELNGSLAVKEKVPGALTIFIDAPLDGARAPAARAGDRERGGDRGPDRARRGAAPPRRALRPRRRERRPRARRRGVRRARRARAGRLPLVCPAMIHPRIDQLLDEVDSRYALVIVAAKRARQINNYHHQLGEGTFDEFPPPLVRSRSKNYLTMSLEEIAEGKISYDYKRYRRPRRPPAGTALSQALCGRRDADRAAPEAPFGPPPKGGDRIPPPSRSILRAMRVTCP